MATKDAPRVTYEPVPVEFMAERDAAKFLAISESTLRTMRREETGPKYYRLPNTRRVIYRPADLREWVMSPDEADTTPGYIPPMPQRGRPRGCK